MELIKNVGNGKVHYQKYLTKFQQPQHCGGYNVELPVSSATSQSKIGLVKY